MLGETIRRKRDDLNNFVNINTSKLQQSPFKTKKLKVRGKIIYPKDLQDQLFLYSEGARNVPLYQCSHSYIYGNDTKTEDFSLTQDLSPYQERLEQERRGREARVKAEKTLLMQKDAFEKTQKLSKELFEGRNAVELIRNEERRLFKHAIIL